MMFEPGGGGGGGGDQMFRRGAAPQQLVEIEFGQETTTKTKKTKKNKRRFSEDQVRWLESLFENETKLEPKQKVEAARELGLHPRQVSIWFQNKRARWKSRLLQQDFDVLRSNYDSLASRFDGLKKENQSLSLQLQKLKELVGGIQDDGKLVVGGGGSGEPRSVATETAANDQESETNNSKNGRNNMTADEEKKPELAVKGGSEYEMGMLRDEGCSDQNTNYFATMEEGTADLLAMVEPACSSLTSDEEWHGLQSDGLFDQSSRSYEWLEFWS